MPRVKKSATVDGPTPEAVIVIQFFSNTVKVDIENFERLTPGKIDRAFPVVQESWSTFQRDFILSKRRGEFEQRLNGEESA